MYAPHGAAEPLAGAANSRMGDHTILVALTTFSYPLVTPFTDPLKLKNLRTKDPRRRLMITDVGRYNNKDVSTA